MKVRWRGIAAVDCCFLVLVKGSPGVLRLVGVCVCVQQQLNLLLSFFFELPTMSEWRGGKVQVQHHGERQAALYAALCR